MTLISIVECMKCRFKKKLCELQPEFKHPVTENKIDQLYSKSNEVPAECWIISKVGLYLLLVLQIFFSFFLRSLFTFCCLDVLCKIESIQNLSYTFCMGKNLLYKVCGCNLYHLPLRFTLSFYRDVFYKTNSWRPKHYHIVSKILLQEVPI